MDCVVEFPNQSVLGPLPKNAKKCPRCSLFHLCASLSRVKKKANEEKLDISCDTSARQMDLMKCLARAAMINRHIS